MKISKQGIDFIKGFEGCKLRAYKCLPTEKYYTIGYGHYGPDVKPTDVITKEYADELFLKDIVTYENYVKNPSFCPVNDELNQNQFDALVSFCYNCGCGSLKTLCKGRTLSQIGNALTLYDRSGGKKIPGLTRRREKEKELFFSGHKTKEGYVMDTLKQGVKSNDVTVFQILMHKLRYYNGKIDGIFGTKCVNACKEFQHDYKECGTNGKPDLVFGQKCWNKLFELGSKK